MWLMLPALLLVSLAVPASGSDFFEPQDTFFDYSGTRGANAVPDLDTHQPQALVAGILPIPEIRRLRFKGERRVSVDGERGREDLAVEMSFVHRTFLLLASDGGRFRGKFRRIDGSDRKLALVLGRDESRRFAKSTVTDTVAVTGFRDFEHVGKKPVLIAKVNRDGDRVKVRGRVPFVAVRDGETVHGTVKIRAVVDLD